MFWERETRFPIELRFQVHPPAELVHLAAVSLEVKHCKNCLNPIHARRLLHALH